MVQLALGAIVVEPVRQVRWQCRHAALLLALLPPLPTLGQVVWQGVLHGMLGCIIGLWNV